MNEFLRRYGLDTNQGGTYVAVNRPDDPEIVAYYNVVPDTRLLMAVPPGEELSHASVWLRYFAVAEKFQRQGIGRRLLLHIITEVMVVNAHPEIESLNLQTLDDYAKRWYVALDFGFLELAPGSRYLTLPVATIRALSDPSA
jgi:GNAT superfamily N-acetyltransferase